MLKIYTTSDCLQDLAKNRINNSCNDWQKVMEISQINYCGKDLFEGDCASDDLSEESKNLLLMAKDGTELNFDTSDYIPSIKDSPEKVLKHPDAVFLLDIEEKDAEKITEEYGVICHSIHRLDNCELTKSGYDKRPTCGAAVTWKDVLDPDRIAPSNSMIFIDRNYFTNVDYDTGELYAFTNLRDFLDAFLPKSLKCDYDILFVFKKEYSTDEDKTRHERYGSKKEGKGKVPSKEYNLTELKDELHTIVKSLGRPYKINIEVLPVERNASPSTTIPARNPYLDTHDRRIITSYNIIETTFSNAAFGFRGSRTSQKISINLSHSNFLDKYQTLPINYIEDTRQVVSDLLKQNRTPSSLENKLVNAPK